MRRLLLLLLALLAVSLPAVGHAQDADASTEDEATDEVANDDALEDGQLEDGQTEGATETATQEGGYEPDQRGVHEGGADGGGGGYEPDQRGDHEEAPSEPESERVQLTSGSAGAYYRDGSLLGLDAQLFFGLGYTGLDVGGDGNLIRPIQSSSIGGTFGLGLGLRIGPVSVGPRFGFVAEPGFVLGTFGLDVRVALLEEVLTPTLRASLGYATLLSLSETLPSQGEVGVQGLSAELGVGVIWRAFGPIVIGAELAGVWTNLSRDAVPACVDPCTDGAFDLRDPGQANGLGLRVQVSTGVSF